MNFKRLEIFGFKSFAEKTVVEFNQGITGIVGPNGSGKSNFSDAIKWVLGEQRPSELRGKNMQDVIFNGTQKRSSMSFCEVTLVFDNSDRKMFSTLEFDEVAISRKLYRSGDSEYLLNNVTCRLKDIKDLIADTGLGKDGYSIIGQGKVAKIINSKPEDRRAIFEDAAGISKYKARKIEAENRLNRTKEHLDKLIFIITDIEKRLGPLEQQSKNARLYNQYYVELKNIEINHYIATYEKTQVSKVEIADTLHGIAEELKQINRDLGYLDRSYNSKLAKISELDELIKDLNNERTELMLERERRTGLGNQFGERLSSQKEQLIKLKDNLDRMSNQHKEYSALLANVNNNKQEAARELAEVREEYNCTSRNFETLVDEIFKREQELEHGNKELFDTLDMLVDVKSDMSKYIADRDNLEQKKGETQYLFDRAKRMIENDEGQRTSINEQLKRSKVDRDNAYNARNQLRNKINETKFAENTISSELNELSGSISSFETKIKLLKTIKEQYEGFQAPLQRLMQEAKANPELNRRIMGIVASVIKVEPKLEVAIETALGAAMQNVITRNDDDVKYIIEILKQKRLGRLTFLPINTFKDRELSRDNQNATNEAGALGIASKIIGYESAYNKIFSGLLGTTLIVDNYDNAVRIFKKYNQSFRIVTLDGEVLSTQGSISGGSRKADNANLLSRDRELEQSVVLLDKARTEHTLKSAKINQLKLDYIANMDKLTEIEEQFNKCEIEYATITEREDKISENLDRLIDELAEHSKNMDAIDLKLEWLTNQLSSVDKREGDISDKRASASDINLKTKQIFEEKNAEKDSFTEQLTSFRVKIANLEAVINGFDEDIERITEDCATLEVAINSDRENQEILLANIKTTENRINSSIVSDKEKEKLDTILAKITDCEDKKKQYNIDIVNINEQKNNKNADTNKVTEKRVKQEALLDKIEGTLFAMTQRLIEEYELNHDQAMLLRDEEFSDEGAVTAIANTKRKITGLGVINTAAIEEYEEVGTRHLQYTTERDDLLKAEADLNKIIADLSHEMLERFNSEFEKISANFQITFKEIFGGGQGQLIIDKNAEDPLSAGIDIYAQPPGKKLQQISLFSGGEMSLTAIAILFAILRNKPMPFCVLDEIEAALDESNVRLFAKYLKRFVHDTQFIVITHRKPTMEQSDRLYGVTMEEKGVSKVVTVEFEDAVQTIEKAK